MIFDCIDWILFSYSLFSYEQYMQYSCIQWNYYSCLLFDTELFFLLCNIHAPNGIIFLLCIIRAIYGIIIHADILFDEKISAFKSVLYFILIKILSCKSIHKTAIKIILTSTIRLYTSILSILISIK